jgi:hypothetical protein
MSASDAFRSREHVEANEQPEVIVSTGGCCRSPECVCGQGARPQLSPVELHCIAKAFHRAAVSVKSGQHGCIVALGSDGRETISIRIDFGRGPLFPDIATFSPAACAEVKR